MNLYLILMNLVFRAQLIFVIETVDKDDKEAIYTCPIDHLEATATGTIVLTQF